MGNDMSAPPIGDNFSYSQVGVSMGNSSSKMAPDQCQQPSSNTSSTLLRTMYHGVWSMSFPQGICPAPRLGQCSAYDFEKDRLIIAYGQDANGQCLNDCWVLDFKSNRWMCLNKTLLSPRTYASASLIGRKMCIFGGVCGQEYFSDLHTIDIDSGDCEMVQNVGQSPSPRASPVLLSSDSFLYLWSGFDGRASDDLYKIGPGTNGWSQISSTHTGRASASFCTHKGIHYIFGAFKGQGLLSFNSETGVFEPVTCAGTEPSEELTHSALVSADEFIFLVGGESHSDSMHVYALEVKRKWWFAFHIRPDNETLNVSDGSINKIGLFMIPREYAVSVAYRPRQRELVSAMGSRLANPPPVFRIAIGPALASLHMRSDMLEMFAETTGAAQK